ncbi:cell division protein SepF [Acaryochloris marina]|uniref:cell division protein SepF n=1 Tax=Acaryochloris marina TaxID=155978 RepID=UPI0021C32394|nr:cell division protein SepF [Acaryochloris marina]
MDNFLPFQGISLHKIRVYHPKSFEDAEEAINTMRTDDMLLVNLVAVKPTLAQRLADYFAGSTFALSGEYIEIGK